MDSQNLQKVYFNKYRKVIWSWNVDHILHSHAIFVGPPVFGSTGGRIAEVTKNIPVNDNFIFLVKTGGLSLEDHQTEEKDEAQQLSADRLQPSCRYYYSPIIVFICPLYKNH